MQYSLRTAALAVALLLGSPALLAAGAADRPLTWDDVKTWSIEKKEEAIASGKKALAATDRKIEQLEAAARKSGKAADAAHQQNMKELKAHRAAAGARLDQLQKAGAEAWNGTRDAFATAYKDLSASHDKAHSGK